MTSCLRARATPSWMPRLSARSSSVRPGLRLSSVRSISGPLPPPFFGSSYCLVWRCCNSAGNSPLAAADRRRPSAGRRAIASSRGRGLAAAAAVGWFDCRCCAVAGLLCRCCGGDWLPSLRRHRRAVRDSARCLPVRAVVRRAGIGRGGALRFLSRSTALRPRRRRRCCCFRFRTRANLAGRRLREKLEGESG